MISERLDSKKKKFNIIVEAMESSIGWLKLKLNKIKRILIKNPRKNIPNITPFKEKFA